MSTDDIKELLDGIEDIKEAAVLRALVEYRTAGGTRGHQADGNDPANGRRLNRVINALAGQLVIRHEPMVHAEVRPHRDLPRPGDPLPFRAHDHKDLTEPKRPQLTEDDLKRKVFD